VISLATGCFLLYANNRWKKVCLIVNARDSQALTVAVEDCQEKKKNKIIQI